MPSIPSPESPVPLFLIVTLSVGIVGLPNAGKSSLFNALTRAGAAVAGYPFTTIEPHHGIAAVPDPRIEAVAGVTQPDRTVPATVEFVDIAGLVRGAHSGEGLGNQFLAHIREVDAIVHVVRCFTAADVPHVEGAVDPMRDIEIVETELAHANLAKPVLYVANISENDLPAGPCAELVVGHAQAHGAIAVPLSVKLEAEVSELGGREGDELLRAYGLIEPGLFRLIRAAYDLLSLITFFTTASREVRAWAVPSGTLAPEAAGKIHTDMHRGFIKAEVIGWRELIEAGSLQKARDRGLVRLEGKEYVVTDGDVVLFRFAV